MVSRRFQPRSRSRLAVGLSGLVGLLLAIGQWLPADVQAQTGGQGTITLRADVQEANALTGVVTARGNVQIEYPTRDIYATSAQAQYFSEERRIILSGNVVVLQNENRLEAETVTYLIDEGRFIALPEANQQVETTYILQDSPQQTPGANSGTAAPAVPESGQFEAPPVPDATLDISPVDAPDTEP